MLDAYLVSMNKDGIRCGILEIFNYIARLFVNRLFRLANVSINTREQ